MTNLVILNEQHSLMENQIEVLNNQYGKGNWKLVSVPSQGLNIEEMNNIIGNQIMKNIGNGDLIFASPIPYMIKIAILILNNRVKIFHNDNREKKELPNGKIIMTVAQTGWQLV